MNMDSRSYLVPHLLRVAVKKGQVDNSSIDLQNVLTSTDFNELSDREKVKVMRLNLADYDIMDNYDTRPGNIMKDIVRNDNENQLRLMLYHVPLYKMFWDDSSKEEKDKQAQVLYEHKARFLETETAKDKGAPENAHPKLAVYRDEAMKVFLLRLINLADDFNATRCRALLDTLVMNCIAAVDGYQPTDNAEAQLLKSHYFHTVTIKDVGEGLRDLYAQRFKRKHNTPHVLYFKTTILLRRNEQAAANYVDENGDNLLHLLIMNIEKYFRIATRSRAKEDIGYFVKCVQLLLDAGVDPRASTPGEEGSLLYLLMAEFGPANRSTPLNKYEALYECTQLLLPYFSDVTVNRKRLMRCAAALIHNTRFNNFALSVGIKMYHLLMQANMLNNEDVVDRGEAPWQVLLSGSNFSGARGLCLTCKPLEELCDFTVRTCRNTSDYVARISIYVTAAHPRDFIHDRFETQVLNGRGTYRPATRDDCCYLTVLSVLLRHGIDIEPVLELEPPNADMVSFLHLASQQPQLGYNWSHALVRYPPSDDLKRICRTLAMYYPRCTSDMLFSIMSCDGDVDPPLDNARQHDHLVQSPLPLEFLAKRCILQNLRHKYMDIDKLPLPEPLQDYLKISEIE